MAELNGWISSIKIEPGAVVTLKDQFPDPNKYTMEVSQSGTMQSLTWQDGKLAIDDTKVGTDTTWSSQKISETQSPPEIAIQDTTPTGQEVLWVLPNGPDPDEYCVRYDINQSLTETEKARARANIGVEDLLPRIIALENALADLITKLGINDF